MKNGWLAILLLLSVGTNLGLLAGRWLWTVGEPTAERPAQTRDGETRDGETRDGEIRDGETRDGEIREGETRDGEILDGYGRGGDSDDGPGDLVDEARPLPPRLERGIRRTAEELGLEGSRLETFVEHQQTFFRRSAQARRSADRAQRALRAELLSENPDRARADAWLDQATRAQADLESAFLDNFFAMQQLLGAEQQEELRRLMVRVREARDELRRRGPNRWRNPARERARPGASAREPRPRAPNEPRPLGERPGDRGDEAGAGGGKAGA